MNHADVVIVGGGIAGASLASRLAGRCKTVLLEAEPQPGYHATGRSAALYTASYGEPLVRALAAASRGFLLDPPQGFAAAPLTGRRGMLWIANAEQAPRLDDFRGRLSATGLDLRPCAPADALRLCPALRPESAVAAALEPEAFDIDVHALLHGYLRAFRGAGGSLVSAAPVRAIRRDGGAWQVDTASGRYACAVVVNAAGAWADGVAALAGIAPAGLLPRRRTAITFDPQGVSAGAPPGEWPCVIDVDETFYFKPDAGRVLASPADQTPAAPGDAQAEELDVAIAVDRVESATLLRVGRVAARWAGLRTFAADGLPLLGMDPQAENFFWLAGQGGYGIMTSPALGALAAGLIAGGLSAADARIAAALAPRRSQPALHSDREPA